MPNDKVDGEHVLYTPYKIDIACHVVGEAMHLMSVENLTLHPVGKKHYQLLGVESPFYIKRLTECSKHRRSYGTWGL